MGGAAAPALAGPPPCFWVRRVAPLVTLPALVVARRGRRRAPPAAALTLPALPFGLGFTGSHWTAERALGLAAGLEDATCLLLLGARAWLCASWAARWEPPATPRGLGWRWGAMTVGGMSLWMGLVALGVVWGDGMMAVAALFLAGALAWRPGDWRPALAAALLSPAHVLGFALWQGGRFRARERQG